MINDRKKSILNKFSRSTYVRLLLLIAVLAFGAYLRFTGIEWDESFHLHPDERFLTMVETSIAPVDSLREYFDTSSSSLNPHNILDANGNQTYPFFVYGTLPIVIVRYLADWFGMAGYGSIYILGRILSGVFDLGTILLVFAIAQKLFGKFWLSWLASFLYACSALPIQISHYFIVDNFTTFFAMLAFLFAAVVFKQKEEIYSLIRPANPIQWLRLNWSGFQPYICFGIALGLAVASKINALAVALLLPIAVFLRNPKGFFQPASPGWTRRFHSLILAAVVSFITFRIFQPYAFNGPSFLNITINREWISDLKELTVLSSGISNYPPSMQWARRSIWFPLKNLTIWGLGIPLSIFAIGGMLWMAWEIIKGNWKEYSLIWIWTFLYTAWQAMRWNPTMRYFLLVYPILAIIAAVTIFQLIKRMAECKFNQRKDVLTKIVSVCAVVFLIAGSAAWSLAFLQVYQKPMTRIAASEWMYDNIEGAVNLQLDDSDGDFIQALPYPHIYNLEAGSELSIDFHPEMDGLISSVNVDHVLSEPFTEDAIPLAFVLRKKGSETILAEMNLVEIFLPDGDSRGKEISAEFGQPISVNADEDYQLVITVPEGYSSLSFYGTIGIEIQNNERLIKQAVFESAPVLEDGSEYYFLFTPKRDAELNAVELFRALNISTSSENFTIHATIQDGEGGNTLGQGTITAKADNGEDFRGVNTIILLDEVIALEANNRYNLTLSIEGAGAEMLFSGSESAKETDWDDALPLYMYGLNPFDHYEGVYQSDLNYQMYWNDDEDKRQRFLAIMDQADYIVITSNRQWGSVTQLPAEFPLTTLYYQALIGCPLDDVQDCYRNAQPGTYSGELGFELEAVFQSNPEIFGVEFNSQVAEEAFTVYDHPKVLIFKKTADFDLALSAEKLYQVDLDKIQHLNPAEAEAHAGDLMLSEGQIEQQKIAGTWSLMFDYEALQNKYPIMSVIIWYLFITILGWVFYPVTRIIFKGLSDNGFALLKLTGLIIWSFLVWWMGSLGISTSRLAIFLVFLLCIAANTIIAWKNRLEIKEELKINQITFLKMELIALAFFLFFLAIRVGNPDLWHPYKGGEKPMDFSYFNAVLKSDQFPPYDPWFAGGYINYYYYGFVLAAVPVKLLGIVPSIAYNLILPTFFCFTGMAAFSFGWNSFEGLRKKLASSSAQAKTWIQKYFSSPFGLGITVAVFVLFIGNLGTILMITEGFQKIAFASDAALASGGIFSRLIAFFKGAGMYFSGANFTYYPGDWYWIPSRTIPGESITEFPFFTFLYGDPHAHLFSYPITLLVLCWIISLINNKLDNKRTGYSILQITAGALFVGMLKPINTWDYPVFLLMAILVLLYVTLRYVQLPRNILEYLPKTLRKIIHVVVIVVGFVGLTYLLYYPFSKWFGQAYSSIQIWQGDYTPIGSYLTHWSLFIFILYSFLIWEIRDWAATTPLSALKPFYEKRRLITAGLILLLGIFMLLLVWEVWVIIVIGPALLMFCMLFFRKDIAELTKLVILMALAGLGLTLMVELIVIHGDIGRMNTVFKFYLQAWTMLALSSAYFLFHLLPDIAKKWKLNWKKFWRVLFSMLLFSILLFPVAASADKISDRMSENVNITLDGMEFMRTATYLENDYLMDLSQDYAAIRWMQDNVSGTPVIIEANVTEYKWGNRFTVYTGLPGVVGWNWHQRQQRAINSSDWIYERVDQVSEFYLSDDLERTKAIIAEYDIEYIIVGQLERAVYESGLEKFSSQNGLMWDEVYSAQETQIYRVKSRLQ